MKKILFAFTLIAGFSFATQAQSTDKTTKNSAEPVKVEVAGQAASDVTTAEPAVAPVKESIPAAKSCCSSKKGKETASAKSKSCCADGKKSKADCADKKDETTISQ